MWLKVDRKQTICVFLDTQVYLAPTPVILSVCPSVVRHTFGFPFCQRHWDLTKRWEDIAVADMVADVFFFFACPSHPIWWEGHAKKKMVKGYPIWWESWSRGLVNLAQTCLTQSFYPTCMSSKLCEFIVFSTSSIKKFYILNAFLGKVWNVDQG